MAAPLHEGQERVRNGAATSCSFAAEFGGHIVIMARRVAGGSWSAQQIERMQRESGHGGFRDFPGLGDRSFLFDLHTAGALLCVFRGGYYLQISVFGMGDAAQVSSAVERLARLALARL
ncbi:MAG: hypothetical protein LAP87_28875 [Acidobacteriia bacterium]|nr:hypothetical protein [Terriglobia bacterium]